MHGKNYIYLFHKEKDISVQWKYDFHILSSFKKKDLVKLKHWRDTYFLEFSWYLWVMWFFSGTASSTKWIGRWPENSKLGLIWTNVLGQNLKSSDESEMMACFPKRWTFLKAATTFTTKVCIKYWKQGHYNYSFSSTIDWPVLTPIPNHILKTELTFFYLLCYLIIFCTFLKKPSSKTGCFSKFAETFSTAKKTDQVCPEQLKTQIAFSMFPILGTNLWFTKKLPIPSTMKRSWSNFIETGPKIGPIKDQVKNNENRRQFFMSLYQNWIK